ncbi:MAG: succinylglutamate desuccinylase/aspartoacylase family protein [Bacteroidales bacterium]|nr:succinylglutamate desuccinylase/aspartoacylase family protein [Bacteroidales bacterium]
MNYNYNKDTTYHYSFIRLMTGHDLSVRRIPLMGIENKKEGPVIVLTACMHGDEIGGTVVIQELFKILRKKLVKGKVYAFPMLNPFGFENTSRRISISNEDLNRSFPGNNKGTLAQRIAFHIMSKIKDINPAVVLDLHNDWNKSIPYVVIDSLPEPDKPENLYRLAKICNLPAIQEPESIMTSLSYCLNQNKIPALTLELGESLIINEKNVMYGINAVLNILYDMGIVKDPSSILAYNMPELARNKILTYSSSPLCSSSGIIRFSKKPGDIVRKGDRIAKVYNAFGKLNETITSVHNGIILGHNDYAVAYPGSPVMAFGVIETVQKSVSSIKDK